MSYKCKVCHKTVTDQNLSIQPMKQKKCKSCWLKTTGKRVYNERLMKFEILFEIECEECGTKKYTKNRNGKFCSGACATKFNRREGNINIVL